MITGIEITCLAAEIMNYFPLFSAWDALSLIDSLRLLKEYENKDELRKAVFQYTQRLENS